MDLELVKMLLNAGVPAVFVLLLIVTQSQKRSAAAEKPDDDARPTYSQIDALLQDFREVSNRLHADHDAVMAAIHDVHVELLRIKNSA